MREVVLRVPRIAVEDILDRLLMIVPGGVRESPVGRHVELKIRGDHLPPRAELKQAVGRWPHRFCEHEVSDDWRERRAADFAAELVGGKLLVRPAWAPPVDRGDVIEIVLGESSAFGGGAHPTTRTCLELLLETPAAGSFADLGCGSGVLAILAARLGWDPVTAIDIQPPSVEATRENAERNGVKIGARVGDLVAEPPPAADAFAANVPAHLHRMLARGLEEPLPRLGILSGFGPAQGDEVAAAYRARGLAEQRRIDVQRWTVLVVASGPPGRVE